MWFTTSRAYLNAVSNALSWHMGDHPFYLWTLPMFHCTVGVSLDISGQCWRVGGLRQVRDDAVYQAMGEHKVTHFAAPRERILC